MNGTDCRVHRCVLLAAAVSAVAVGSLGWSAAVAAAVPSPAQPSHALPVPSPVTRAVPPPLGQSVSTSSTAAVGALFHLGAGGTLGAHFCSASVVSSGSDDLVLTAAHCVSRLATSAFAFVPGYDNGRLPYGVWDITAIFVDSAWAKSSSANDDFAFLVTAPSKSGKRLQSLAGAETLGINQAPLELVRVTGYPDGGTAPITCQNWTKELSSSQLEFDCGGYTDGTSGSPFVAKINSTTGLGTVIGVIGGYEQGGYTPSVSYAARLLASAQALYETAANSAAARAG